MAFTFNPLRKGKLHFSFAGTTTTITAVGKTLIEMPNATTPGLSVVLDITGYTWSCDWNAYPVNCGLGVTTTVDWNNDMPHFWYLGNNNNTAAGLFAFTTRDPRMGVTPAAGLINDTAAAGATAQSQNHINSWEADDATNAAKPCVCLGSSCFTWETDAGPTADVWEAQTLTTKDGFGMFQEGVQFTMPAGQMGAAANKYFLDNGGTAPTWATTNNCYYFISRDGILSYYTTHEGNCSAGAGAVIAKESIPYTLPTTISGTSTVLGNGYIKHSAGSTEALGRIMGYSGQSSVFLYTDAAATYISAAFATAGNVWNMAIIVQVF